MIITSRSIGNPLAGRCPTWRWLLGLSILYLLYTTNLLISSFHHHQQRIHCPSVHLSSDPSSRPPPPPIASSSSAAAAVALPPMGLQHIVFRIMASVRLWEKRRDASRCGGGRGIRGYVWLDKSVAEPNASSALAAIKISADHQQHIHWPMERAVVRRTKRKRRVRRAGRGCWARPGGLGVSGSEEDEEEEEGEEGGSGQPLELGEGRTARSGGLAVGGCYRGRGRGGGRGHGGREEWRASQSDGDEAGGRPNQGGGGD